MMFHDVLLLVLQILYLVVCWVQHRLRQLTDGIQTMVFLGRIHQKAMGGPIGLKRVWTTAFRDKFQAPPIQSQYFNVLKDEFSHLTKRPHHMSVALPMPLDDTHAVPPINVETRAWLSLDLTEKISPHPHHGSQKFILSIAHLAYWCLAAEIPCLSVYFPNWGTDNNNTSTYGKPTELQDNSQLWTWPDWSITLDELLDVLGTVQQRVNSALIAKARHKPTLSAEESLKSPTGDDSNVEYRIVVVRHGKRYPVPILSIPSVHKSSKSNGAIPTSLSKRHRPTKGDLLSTCESSDSDEVDELDSNIAQRAPRRIVTFDLQLLDFSDGFDRMAVVAKKLCVEAEENSDFELSHINVQRMNNELRLSPSHPDPNLHLVVGGPFSMGMYPPWALRYAQIYHAPEYHCFTYPAFRKALYKYANCQQRWGQ
ncbi:hypothetical protein IWQ62_004041 [Dispira parvispora]|uniref:ditrans,polycis-polyprenyl diphosphate synthase [(2E,6E)-farnesyldiphosphate specific] n=1 Tax=Dispira parvispora TaxID=1520584 RepID=A0A9W8AT56_9FUNG|nr:hypothetical protein IWQ62_004041 [Dispira parvispora]